MDTDSARWTETAMFQPRSRFLVLVAPLRRDCETAAINWADSKQSTASKTGPMVYSGVMEVLIKGQDAGGPKKSPTRLETSAA